MTHPARNKFLHWCHGCGNMLLPYGSRCQDCGKTDPLPVSRLPATCRPWHQLATTTVLRLGKAYIAVDYEITDMEHVIIKCIRARGKPSITVRQYYQRMIINQIAKAEGIL